MLIHYCEGARRNSSLLRHQSVASTVDWNAIQQWHAESGRGVAQPSVHLTRTQVSLHTAAISEVSVVVISILHFNRS